MPAMPQGEGNETHTMVAVVALSDTLFEHRTVFGKHFFHQQWLLQLFPMPSPLPLHRETKFSTKRNCVWNHPCLLWYFLG